MAVIKSPMAVRIPLLDPDRFLEHTMPFVRPLFSVPGFALWLALVAIGAVLAAMNWAELSESAADRVLAADNLLLLALTIPSSRRCTSSGTPMRPRRAAARSTKWA
ncbi:MAG: hypothetical protein WDO24_04820 [Pseudomonadota bacterium]